MEASFNILKRDVKRIGLICTGITSHLVTEVSSFGQYTKTDRTIHQFLTITDLDLITEFDFLPNCTRFP